MKTGKVLRYALILILIVLLLRFLPFLWAIFWYSLPFVLLLFLVAQLVIFFNKDQVLLPGQPNGEEQATAGVHESAHSWRTELYQFLLLVKEKRVMNGLWKVFFPALVIVTVVTSLAYYLGNSYWQRRHTQTEIGQISLALERYKNELKGYPEKLGVLIGNNPLNRDWENDGWGNNYSYEVASDKQKFSLISKGKDGILHTNDDMIAKKE